MKIWNIYAKKVEEVKPEYGVRLMEQGRARKATPEEAAIYEAKIAGATKTASPAKAEGETAAPKKGVKKA